MESRRGTTEKLCASESLTSSSRYSREWKCNFVEEQIGCTFFPLPLYPPASFIISALSLLWCISQTHTFCVLVHWWLCLLQGQDMETSVKVALLSTTRSHYILEQSRLSSVLPFYCVWLYCLILNSQECELPHIMPF